MNVLLIHQSFSLPHEAGGSRHWELGQYLARRGNNLNVVTSDVNYLTGKRTPARRRPGGWARQAEDGGIYVIRVSSPPVLHRSFFWRVVVFLWFSVASFGAALRIRDVDIVMGTSPPIFQALSAWGVAKLRRKPFLLEVRDLWPEFAVDMGVLRNPPLIAMARWLERFLYRQADHLLVNSPAFKDYLRGKDVPSAKITVIPNGTDIELFDPTMTGQAARCTYGLNERFVVVYAGAQGMANDLGTLLNAAERLRAHRTIHILLVGDGKERASLERQARERGLDNVTFAGPIPKTRMPEVLAAADVCVATLMNVPLFKTIYSEKVFDYMAAGRPVIAAIDGVVRQMLEQSGAGLFTPPGDGGALADAILMLKEDGALRRRMGTAGRQCAVTRFDHRVQAAAFLNLAHALGGIGHVQAL